MNSLRRPCWRAGLVALGLFLLPLNAFAAEVTPVEILRNPSLYTGRSITLRGTITNLRPGPMVAGRPITVFEVFDSGAFVTVFSRIPTPCQVGSPVTVQGVFELSRVVGRERFVNLVEAFSVVCRQRLPPEPKKTAAARGDFSRGGGPICSSAATRLLPDANS